MIREKVKQQNLLELISDGETMTVEFKSTLRWDIKQQKISKVVEFEITKTIAAFFNSKGGTLFIGVGDQKQILGLDKDFSLFSKPDKEDAFKLQFDNMFKLNFGSNMIRYVSPDFMEIDGKLVFVVEVEKSPSEIIVKDEGDNEKFFIRLSGGSSALKLSEANKYIRDHWGNPTPNHYGKPQFDIESMFDSEKNFRNVMKALLNDTTSVYYQEVKDYADKRLEDLPFLNDLIDVKLAKSLKYGILSIISDFTSKHLNEDVNAKTLYNQKHIFLHDSSDEDFRLPMFTHIHFIGILYDNAIINKIDIEYYGKNLSSIYSTMIERMIDKLSLEGIDINVEYPTNYHYLIGEIFSVCNHWFDLFNEEENFISGFSYTDYIAFNLRWCMEELYKAHEKHKITQKFMNSRIYYGILHFYFEIITKEELRDSIDQNIISQIPVKYLKPIFEFALDEKFALQYYQFCNSRFRGVNNKEIEIQAGLRDILRKYQKL